jgi:predicted transposase YbfD/YdcC
MRYALAPLLMVMTRAKLCGEATPQAMAEWMSVRSDMGKALRQLPWKRMPHARTSRRVRQQGGEVTQLEQEAGTYWSTMSPAASAQRSLDGKTFRGTMPTGEPQGVPVLAGPEVTKNFVLAHREVGVKENDISAAPRLMGQVEGEGKVVSGDAMPTQRALSAQIVEHGGEYLGIVKEHQPTLRMDIATLFMSQGTPGTPTAFRTARTLDTGHGRIEPRRLTASSALHAYLDWPSVGQVLQMERASYDGRTQHTRSELVYGITSLPAAKAEAARLMALMRNHWRSEHGLHDRRDVTFQEDACRRQSRTAAQVLAVLNHLTIGVIRHLGWHNAAEARRFFAARIGEALSPILCCPS